MRLLLICVVIAAACGVAVAQKSGGAAPVAGGNTGGPVPPPIGSNESMVRDPDVYSRSVTGKILKIDSTGGLIMIEGAGKTRLTFSVDEKVRARADKDTPLGGRKDLTLTDYQIDQVVKVTYRVSDNKALEVRLKRTRS